MPVIKLDYTNTKIQDTVIQSGSPTVNYGTSVSYIVNNSNDGLLKFDLGLIPNSAIINSATLSLTTGSSNAVPLDFYNVLSDWNEMVVTWNTKPSVDATKLFTVTTPSTATTMTIDVKNIVQQWVNGLTNFGLCIKSTSATSVTLHGNEATGIPNRPTLTVDYTIPTTDKKQVEFIDKGSASVAASVPTISIPIPTSRNANDMLVAYVQVIGPSATLPIPSGWEQLTARESSGSTAFTYILYKKSDGTETTFSATFSVNAAYIGSVHVYRNVKAIYSHGAARLSSDAQPYPNPPTDLLSNRLLILFTTVVANTSGTPPLNFEEEVDFQAASLGNTNIVSHSYNHNKTVYNYAELVTKITSSFSASCRAISLEPITNEVPKIDGKDEFLGSLASPLIKPYMVTDTESDKITITEKLNGNKIRQYTGTGAQTLNLTPQWASLPVGKHTVTVEANDDYNNPPHTPTVRTWTFLKILPDTATLTESVTGLHQVVPYLQSQKAIMGNVLRAKGAMVKDTDRLEDMANALKAGPISGTASGTISGNSVNGTLTRHDAVAVSVPYVPFDMSMLPFVPSKIFFYKTNKSGINAPVWCYENIYEFGTYYGNSAHGGGTLFRVPYTNGVVNIPVDSAGSQYSWIAYEKGALT